MLSFHFTVNTKLIPLPRHMCDLKIRSVILNDLNTFDVLNRKILGVPHMRNDSLVIYLGVLLIRRVVCSAPFASCPLLRLSSLRASDRTFRRSITGRPATGRRSAGFPSFPGDSSNIRQRANSNRFAPLSSGGRLSRKTRGRTSDPGCTSDRRRPGSEASRKGPLDTRGSSDRIRPPSCIRTRADLRRLLRYSFRDLPSGIFCSVFCGTKSL